MALLSLTAQERRSVFSFASLFSIRFLGLFMLLPVLTLATSHLPGATPDLIGLALGSYGFTQALCQLPFGLLSDRWGRKRILGLGLTLFTAGSCLGALSHSIQGIIFARALQGSGAIGSTIMASITDITLPEHRAQAMALIGGTIGLSFGIAMILGPLLFGYFGLSGLFWTCVVLGIGGIGLLVARIPPILPVHTPRPPKLKSGFWHLVAYLWPFNIGIGVLHAILTTSFLIIPAQLVRSGIPLEKQWLFYSILLGLAAAAVFPMIVKVRQVIWYRRFLMGAALCLFLFGFLLNQKILWNPIAQWCILWIMFSAFSLSEALLPALLSRMAPSDSRGIAMGIFSTCQFLGIFVGGVLGGQLLQVGGEASLCLLIMGLSLILWYTAYRSTP